MCICAYCFDCLKPRILVFQVRGLLASLLFVTLEPCWRRIPSESEQASNIRLVAVVPRFCPFHHRYVTLGHCSFVILHYCYYLLFSSTILELVPVLWYSQHHLHPPPRKFQNVTESHSQQRVNIYRVIVNSLHRNRSVIGNYDWVKLLLVGVLQSWSPDTFGTFWTLGSLKHLKDITLHWWRKNVPNQNTHPGSQAPFQECRCMLLHPY